MIIAVDAAGGDYYPKSPGEGSIQAIEEDPNLTVILVGPEEVINNELDGHNYDRERLLVQHAPEVIGMDESPAQAVKSKQNSSIVTGVGMHKKGKCDAFLSAGNTGALLAASTFLLGKLEGASRPTIAAIYPTIKGPRLVMDAGANLEVRPSMFVEFAKMGRVFASEIIDVEDPQIGLLNVGEEEEKGTENLKNAYDELQSLPNFIGNVEGGDIFSGKADVFLCDGLIGNIVLKFGESIPEALELFVKKGIRDLGLGAKEAKLVSKVLKTSLAEFDPDKVGGVPFLGVDGLTMVGHGSSSPLAIKNMILSAAKCVDHNINEKIVASLK